MLYHYVIDVFWCVGYVMFYQFTLARVHIQDVRITAVYDVQAADFLYWHFTLPIFSAGFSLPQISLVQFRISLLPNSYDRLSGYGAFSVP